MHQVKQDLIGAFGAAGKTLVFQDHYLVRQPVRGVDHPVNTGFRREFARMVSIMAALELRFGEQQASHPSCDARTVKADVRSYTFLRICLQYPGRSSMQSS
jgi:hypothetical protein